MKTKITIPTGTVTAIGKFKVFKTEKFNFTIPVLTFIVAKKDDVFTASCIHLLLDASGKSEDEAISRLQKECGDYLCTIFNTNDKETAWEILRELFTSECATEFWNGYQEFKLFLSAKDIYTENTFINFLTKKIENLTQQIRMYSSKEVLEPINIERVSYASRDTRKNKAVA